VSRTRRVAVVQAGSDPFDTEATLASLDRWLDAARGEGAGLAVFPEAFVGGYPKGVDFGARVGSRDAAGRDLFRRYWDNAVALDSPRFAAIQDIVARHGLACVIGAIEQKGATLYCSTFGFERDGSLLGVHRKLMPTAMERLIWGFGSGADLPVMASSAGRLVSAICWENYMPLLRAHYYAQNPDFYCVSTVDDRPVWLPSMQMIALESRSFVLSACQYLERGRISLGADLYDSVPDNASGTVLIRGGSCIISPLGTVLAGPVFAKEAILTAEVDLDEIVRGKFDLDVSGHYARNDVFNLDVNIPQKT